MAEREKKSSGGRDLRVVSLFYSPWICLDGLLDSFFHYCRKDCLQCCLGFFVVDLVYSCLSWGCLCYCVFCLDSFVFFDAHCFSLAFLSFVLNWL